MRQRLTQCLPVPRSPCKLPRHLERCRDWDEPSPRAYFYPIREEARTSSHHVRLTRHTSNMLWAAPFHSKCLPKSQGIDRWTCCPMGYQPAITNRGSRSMNSLASRHGWLVAAWTLGMQPRAADGRQLGSGKPAVSLGPRSEGNPARVLSTLGKCLPQPRYSLRSLPRPAWHRAP